MTVARMSGVSEADIRDLERGDRDPSFDTLSRSVTPMGLSLSELFNESEDKADSLLAFLKALV